MAGRRILVTGAGGFVGSRLRRLLGERGAAVVGWGRRSGDRDIRTVDLADAAAVRHAAAAAAPLDGVLHLASAGRMLAEADIPREIAMWRHLLEQFGDGSCRLVFFGSADQYGDVPEPQSEWSPCRGSSPYARAKTACDECTAEWRSARGADVVTLRPFSVYGPGQPGHMFLAQLISACRRGETFEMSAGLQRRDFVHVDDVCNAALAALAIRNPAERLFNVGTGTGRSLRDAAEQVVSLTGADIRVDFGRVHRSHDPRALVADTRRTASMLGWRAETTFEVGIRRIWAGIE